MRASCALPLLLGLAAAALLLGARLGGQEPASDPNLEIRPFDRVVLENGNTIEGEIIDENEIRLVILTPSGIQSAHRLEEIRRILRRNPPRKVYDYRRTHGFDATRFEDQLELGEWCAGRDVGLVDEAVHHLEIATRLRPGEAEAYGLLLGGLYDALPREVRSSPERRDAEIGVCLRGMRAGLSDPRLPHRAARILETTGGREGAIRLLKKLASGGDAAREQAPEIFEEGEERLARLLEEEGRRDEARALVRDVLKRRDGRGALPFLELRARWLLEDVARGEEGAPALLDDTISQILEIDRGHGVAYMLRGCARMLREDFAGADGDFKRAFSGGVVGGEASITIALNLARRGSFEKAREMLRSSRNVVSLRVLHRLVDAYLRENRGDDDEALRLLEEAVEMEEAPWQAWILQLQTRERLRPGGSVEEEAMRFLARHGDNPVAFAECAVLLGDVALRRRDGARARRWLDYAAAARPPDAELLLRLGHANLDEGGDLRRARAALEEGLEIAPEDLDLLNAAGCLEYRSGDLVKAREYFESVIERFPEKEREAAEPPEALAYALRGRAQVDAAVGEESWRDAFDREDGARVLNNWLEKETFGVDVTLWRGAARFAGVQKFQPDGLTILHRPFDPQRLTRMRALIRLGPGAEGARVGLRLEDESGQGIVFFRDLDGVLAFSLNTSRGAEVVRPESAEDGGEEIGSEAGDDEDGADAAQALAEEHDLKRIAWPDDDSPHLMEIRIEGDEQGSVALYLDGARVARRIRLPFRLGKGSIQLGVSGQADLDKSYRFDVLEFEVFRGLPEGRTGVRY
ncbi:MAG: tetratricopeptide repeat protein [Planctomycetota bacterium]